MMGAMAGRDHHAQSPRLGLDVGTRFRRRGKISASTSTTTKMLLESNNMKRTLFVAVLLTGLLTVQAQERLSREEALEYAFFTSVNLKEMLQTPIPTDPDVKRPVAMRDDEQHGGMVLPESKLSADTFAKAGTEVIPGGATLAG